MAEIKHFDENDLQRKIKEILNQSGFHFEITPHDFDLIDEVEKIYVEVKTKDFAPAQLLYAIAKNHVENVKYIGLACDCEIRFYEPPILSRIVQFAKEIDPDLAKSPSNINYRKWEKEAFALLGDHVHIYTYDGKLDLSERETRIFIDKNNYEYFARLFEKYDINPSRFLTYITAVYENNQEIKINNEGRILNLNTRELFRDIDQDTKQTKINEDECHYRPIRDPRDRALFENTRITSNEINRVLKQMDRLEPTRERRKKGRFFTHENTSEQVTEIVKMLDPDYILEPFAGTGSLIEPVIEDYKGVANDIVKGYMDTLAKNYEGSGWKFTSLDTITTTYTDLFKKWEIPIGKNVLILTNPPFGSSRRDKRNSPEFEKGEEKRIQIEYGGMGDKYGRGDQVLPALAKCIEIIKRVGKGYIATFSPAGVMLNRYRYRKVFGAFLRDFEFIEGHIFSGENFNSVTSKKPIAFTIWRFSSNFNQEIDQITYWFGEREYELRRLPLLKDYWRYNVAEKQDGEIAVQHNDMFNAPVPKMFHLKVKKGGSELIQENVKEELNIPNVPDPLIYGLWSVSVGYRSITDYPVAFDNCYTHLPDLDHPKTMEILAYAVIHSLITELKQENCKGEIGFVGGKRFFKFGGERLTEGAKYLIETCSDCPIGSENIGRVFKQLKQEPDIEKINNDYRSMIKKEMEERLDDIGYWDYLPISEIKKPTDKGLAKLKGIGDSTKLLLQDNGIESITDLADCSVEDLCEIKGIGKKTAEKYIKKAEKYRIEKITFFMKEEE